MFRGATRDGLSSPVYSQVYYGHEFSGPYPAQPSQDKLTVLPGFAEAGQAVYNPPCTIGSSILLFMKVDLLAPVGDNDIAFIDVYIDYNVTNYPQYSLETDQPGTAFFGNDTSIRNMDIVTERGSLTPVEALPQSNTNVLWVRHRAYRITNPTMTGQKPFPATGNPLIYCLEERAAGNTISEVWVRPIPLDASLPWQLRQGELIAAAVCFGNHGQTS